MITQSTPAQDDSWRPMHAVVFVVLTAAAGFVPVFHIWPVIWLMPLAAYVALVWVVPPLRATFRPWRFGHVSKTTVLATAIIAIGSSAVLVAFHTSTHPDVHAFRSFVPVSALGGVVMGCILFSFFNALFEEVIFRGILFDAVESQWGGRVAVVTTAFLFGYGHMRGYPPGPTGAVLAGVYGLCLGWLRVFSGGIGLPFIAHIAADVTIFTLIARSGAL